MRRARARNRQNRRGSGRVVVVVGFRPSPGGGVLALKLAHGWVVERLEQHVLGRRLHPRVGVFLFFFPFFPFIIIIIIIIFIIIIIILVQSRSRVHSREVDEVYAT